MREEEEPPPPFDEAVALCPLVESAAAISNPFQDPEGAGGVPADGEAEGRLEALAGMGFDRDAAAAALECRVHTRSDVETAVALLAAAADDANEQPAAPPSTQQASTQQASKRPGDGGGWKSSFKSIASTTFASKAMAFGQKLDATLLQAADKFDKTFDKADRLGDKAAAGVHKGVQKMSLNVASKASSLSSSLGRKVSGASAAGSKAASDALQEAKAALEMQSIPLHAATVSHQLRTGAIVTGICVSGKQVLLATETVGAVTKLSSALFRNGPSASHGEVVGLELDEGVLQRVWWTEFSKCGVSALAVCEGQGGGGWRVVVVGDDKGGLGSILIHEPDDCGGNGNKEMYFHPTDRGGRKESLASYSSQHGRRVCSLVATAPASSFRRIVSGSRDGVLKVHEALEPQSLQAPGQGASSSACTARQELSGRGGAILAMGLHPDGRRLVALCADSSLYQASLSARGVESFGDKDEGEGGAIERGVLVEGGSLQMAVAAPHVGACCCLAMAECGSLIATAGEGGDGRDDVGVWEFVGNEIRLSFRLGLPMGEARGAAGGLGPVECLTWCGDSALAVGTSSGYPDQGLTARTAISLTGRAVILWRMPCREGTAASVPEPRVLQTHLASICRLAWDPVRQALWVAGRDGWLRMFQNPVPAAASSR